MAKRYEFRRIVTEKGYSFPIGLETVSRTPDWIGNSFPNNLETVSRLGWKASLFEGFG